VIFASLILFCDPLVICTGDPNDQPFSTKVQNPYLGRYQNAIIQRPDL